MLWYLILRASLPGNTNRKLFAHFVFLLLLIPAFANQVIFGAELKYEHIAQKEYISLHKFRKLARNVDVKTDPLLLTAEFVYQKNSVRIQVDSNFYISNGDQYPLEYPPVFYKNEIYLPRALVEELFTDLGLSVKFNFSKENLFVKQESAPEKTRLNLDFIMIDPGHGGKDPGAFGITSVMEKKITLETSVYLYKYLKREYPGLKVYMTRYNDEFIPLETRSEMANKKIKADDFGIFLSIHCNSALQPRVSGYEIFYLSQNPGSDEDRKVMMRENDLVSSGDPEIGLIESYLLNSQILAESKMLARQFNRTLLTQLKGLVSSRGVRKADFRVLRNSLMPAILLEIGYISNNKEVSVLNSEKFKEELAKAVSAGIRNFLKYRPKI